MRRPAQDRDVKELMWDSHRSTLFEETHLQSISFTRSSSRSIPIEETINVADAQIEELLPRTEEIETLNENEKKEMNSHTSNKAI